MNNIFKSFKWNINFCWNKRGERTLEIVKPFDYNGRVHFGFSAGLFTVGFWRYISK